jgi:aryl-phospho-beta-D-glucosidase BglC (GH1 family)
MNRRILAQSREVKKVTLSFSVRPSAPKKETVPIFLVAAAILFLSGAASRPPQPAPSRFVRADGPRLLAPDGSPLLLRGIGLGNWLLAEAYMFRLDDGPESERQIRALVAELIGPDAARRFWREWRERYVTREDVQFIARSGLNSIRVPFNFRLLTPEDEPDRWLEDGFAVLDRVIGWAREAGLYVILDLHGAPGGQTGENIDDSWGRPWLFESRESQDRLVELWRRIATRYRDEPVIAGYELLNEPLPHWDELRRYDAQLEPLYRRVTEAIRSVDPNHVVILGGAKWNRDFSVFGAPFAPNLLYAFHKYWDEVTDASIQPYLDFRARHQVPVWLGESGENDDAWVASTVALSERHGIGWCFWPYKKMERTSAMVSFDRPVHWDEVVAYAKLRDASFEAKRKARPSIAVATAAFNDLLRKIVLANCRVNEGYLRALGARR